MHLIIPSIVGLMLLVATPTGARSQGLGSILGPVVGPVDSLLRRGVRRALRPHVYRPRIRSPRSSAASRSRAIAQSPQIVRDEALQPKPFWPDAPEHIFDYILSSEGAGLWAHGYGAVVVSIFTQPAAPAETQNGARLATSDASGQTVGAALAGDDEPVCDERDLNRAEEVVKEIAAILAADQQAVLAELHSGLRRAENEMVAACPRSIPVTMPERLRVMQDRLWAIRVTVTHLRSSLQKFHDALTNEQKAKLEGQGLSPRESKKTDAPSQCHVLTQQSPQWPTDKIVRALRPDKAQQAPLEALGKASSQMGLLMMSACPQKMPATPVARLDATLDWLDAVLFAGVNMAAEVEGIYHGLNEEQKEKLDKLKL